MTEGTNVSLEFKTNWPSGSLDSAVIVNQILIADPAPTGAGTRDGGFYLAFGHLAPPSYTDDELEAITTKGGSVQLFVAPRSCQFLTHTRGFELLQMLQAYYASLEDGGAQPSQRSSQ